MNREQITRVISSKLKVIRAEQNLNQETMAQVLGISKKTLLQIEKGRSLASWPIVVTVCALFRDSKVIRTEFGNDPLDLLRLLAFEKSYRPLDKTLGGHVWWRTVTETSHYRLQQNLISQHYRIIDKKDYRWFSTLSFEEAQEVLQELAAKPTNMKEE